MRYLTTKEVNVLVEDAVTAYEFNCSWPDTYHDVIDSCLDHYGYRPRKSLVLHVLNLAKLKWRGYAMKVKREVNQ